MAKMKPIDWTAIVLLIVGGLNWGLVGAFQFDLVEYLLGSFPAIVRVVYGLVGVSAVYSIYSLSKL